jgi:6-phosphofructokinase 1
MGGSTFSIMAVAEGAISKTDAEARTRMLDDMVGLEGPARKSAKRRVKDFDAARSGGTSALASRLSEMTGLESRLTILGHVQRGGTPSPADRLLATRLGAACADYIAEGVHGVLVAARGESTAAVPLSEVAGRTKSVPVDHPWVMTARHMGIALGD